MILINLLRNFIIYTFNANWITGRRCYILKNSHLFQIIVFLDFFWEYALQLLILILLNKVLRLWSNISLNILSFWICQFLCNFRKIYCVFIFIQSQIFVPLWLDVVPIFNYFFNRLFFNDAKLFLNHPFFRHH